ncbi:ribonuclease H-like domain-containing protein [Scleroderma yunnanense]
MSLVHHQQTLPLYVWQSRSTCPSERYITHHRVANDALSTLPRGPIGFDLEWRPNFIKGQPENPVAVVQIASADTVLIIQVSKMKTFPSKLQEVLYSTEWLKIGVSIQRDCEKLYKDWRISVRNCVDLSLLARSIDNARWKGRYTNPIGLARLLETYDMTTLAKGKTQRSNWESTLSPSQQTYAANDAHAAYTIYSHLLEMARVAQPVLHPIYFSFSYVGGTLLDHLGRLPWVPKNPNYDPGPPPPPKAPKQKAPTQDQQPN